MDEEIKSPQPGLLDFLFDMPWWCYAIAFVLIAVVIALNDYYVRRFLRSLYYRCINWYSVKTTTPLPLKVVKGEYPANTRYVDETEKPRFRRMTDGRLDTASLFVVEVSPGIRVVNIEGKPVALHFPYTYFIIRYVDSMPSFGMKFYGFVSLSVCFSVHQIKHSKAMVARLPLSNYMSGCLVCLGNSHPKGVFYNLRELGEAAITCFWRTAFQMERPEEWEYHTKAGTGSQHVASLLKKDMFFPIGALLGVDDEPFYNFQFEPKPDIIYRAEPSEGGDKPHRRKKRKNSRRKT